MYKLSFLYLRTYILIEVNLFNKFTPTNGFDGFIRVGIVSKSSRWLEISSSLLIKT